MSVFKTRLLMKPVIILFFCLCATSLLLNPLTAGRRLSISTLRRNNSSDARRRPCLQRTPHHVTSRHVCAREFSAAIGKLIFSTVCFPDFLRCRKMTWLLDTSLVFVTYLLSRPTQDAGGNYIYRRQPTPPPPLWRTSGEYSNIDYSRGVI